MPTFLMFSCQLVSHKAKEIAMTNIKHDCIVLQICSF